MGAIDLGFVGWLVLFVCFALGLCGMWLFVCAALVCLRGLLAVIWFAPVFGTPSALWVVDVLIFCIIVCGCVSFADCGLWVLVCASWCVRSIGLG